MQVLVEVILDCYNLPVDLKIDISQGHTMCICAAREGQVAIVEMFCKRSVPLTHTVHTHIHTHIT
jgi:hypothetical protein